MIDTIACFCPPSRPLLDTMFDGGLVSSDFGDQNVNARLWLNPKGTAYLPRVTYWRGAGIRVGRDLMDIMPHPSQYADTGLLKIEFSVPKLADVGLNNPTADDVARALELATTFVRETFDADLPAVATWGCQRVDYAWNWNVGRLLPAYMSVLHKLRVKNYARHPYDANEGVVWKSTGTRGRWVKFYNKTREQGHKRDTAEVLRFEVSNYRDAARYMAEKWYGCKRSVGEMARMGRGLYILGVHWDMLGLGEADSYGHEELVLVRLRDAFETRAVGAAYHALHMIRDYGTAAYSEDVNLISRSAYYRWRSRLTKAGLLTHTDNRDVPVSVALDALHLPTDDVYHQAVAQRPQNLEDNTLRIDTPTKKNTLGNWPDLAAALELSDHAPASSYLLRRWNEYQKTSDLGGLSGAVGQSRHGDVVTGASVRVGDDGGFNGGGTSDRNVAQQPAGAGRKPAGRSHNRRVDKAAVIC